MSDKKQFVLYWSSLDKFEHCPQQFLWSKGWGDIDCGGGPGKKKPIPVESSKHSPIMGIAIQYAVERMYKDQLWRMPGLLAALTQLAEEEFKNQLKKSYVDFRKVSREEMLQVIRDGVIGWIKTFKQHKLIGPHADAEVDLVGFVNKYTPIGGRVDTLFKREDTGVTIIDGKNSKRYKDRQTDGWMTYTDPDQLRWYALCFYLAYHKMPERLGFVYYRYPYGTPKVDLKGLPVLDDDGTQGIEQGVEWISCTKDDIKGLALRAVEARKEMDKEKFPAVPAPSYCRLCDWESVCPQRQAQKESNRRTKKPGDATLDVSAGQTFSLGFDAI